MAPSSWLRAAGSAQGPSHLRRPSGKLHRLKRFAGAVRTTPQVAVDSVLGETVAADEAKGKGVRDPLFLTAVMVAAALLLALAWPLLSGELYVYSDLGRFHLPFRFFYARALAAGDSFLWFPNEFMGFYAHGEGQGTFAHPLNLLQYGLLPFHAAFSIELMRTYVFLLVGTFALLVRGRLPLFAAALGALLFTFGSFNFLHFAHMNFTAIVAHLPWILLATDVALRTASARARTLSHLCLALLVASQLLHAHPQMTWISLLVLGLYGLDYLIRGADDARQQSVRVRIAALWPVAWAVVLGFGLAAVQLLPQWEALGASLRADPESGFSNSYALAPINAVQLVAPYLFKGRTVGSNTAGFAYYAGAVVPPLVMWAYLRRRTLGESSPWLRFGAVLAVLGFVLALGETGILYRLQQMLPVVGLFRAPGRYVVVSQLGLALVAAIAFADLARSRDRGVRPAWRTLWPLGVPLALGIGVSAWIGLDAGLGSRAGWPAAEPVGIGVGLLLLGTTTALIAWAARGQRLALVALLVLTGADLGVYGLSYVRALPTIALSEWVGFGDPPPVPPGERLGRGPAVLTLRGVRLAGGYAALTPTRTLPVGLPASRSADIDPRTLRNARRVASVAVPASRRPAASPMPRVRLVSHAEVTDDVLARIGTIDAATTALVASPVEIGPGPPGEATLLEDRPGRMRISTSTKSRQLLVISESYHSGWRADSGPTHCDLLPVYADLIGCVVPAGQSEIELVFEPWSFVLGLRISLASLALGVAWLGLAMARGRSVATDRARGRVIVTRDRSPASNFQPPHGVEG